MEIGEYPLSNHEQALMLDLMHRGGDFSHQIEVPFAWVADDLPPTRNVKPRELKVGDKIVTGTKKSAGRRTYTTARVEKVEHWACSQRNTHVNGSDCYSWHLPVKVLA